MIGAQEACDKYGIELKIVDGKADSLKIMDAIDNAAGKRSLFFASASSSSQPSLSTSSDST